ncbi:MAG: hypothetical protein II119_01205 [Bacilli bacterium]|jgi:hypothetical protein|nr:hypothetical protein [Bacilli bacterium]
MRESILAMIRRNYESGERALEIQSKNASSEISKDRLYGIVMTNYSNSELALGNNGIYFCDGVLHEDMAGEFKCYRNLEDTTHNYNVYLSDCAEFEKKHAVIYGESYDAVRKEFILDAIKSSQKEAVKSLVKKYSRK